MTHEVFEFIAEHNIHIFNTLQTLTTNQCTSFVSKEVHQFVKSSRIKFLNLSQILCSGQWSGFEGDLEGQNLCCQIFKQKGKKHIVSSWLSSFEDYFVFQDKEKQAQQVVFKLERTIQDDKG